jgi:hypothetical protein
MNTTAPVVGPGRPARGRSKVGAFHRKFVPDLDGWLAADGTRSLPALSAQAKCPLALLWRWHGGRGKPTRDSLPFFLKVAKVIGLDVADYWQSTEMARLRHLTRRQAAALRGESERSQHLRRRCRQAKAELTGVACLPLQETNPQALMDSVRLFSHRDGFWVNGIAPSRETMAEATWLGHDRYIGSFYAYLINRRGWSRDQLRLGLRADAQLTIQCCLDVYTKPAAHGLYTFLPYAFQLVSQSLSLLHNPAAKTEPGAHPLTTDTNGWIRANSHFAMLPHFQTQLRADLNVWNSEAEVDVPVHLDLADHGERAQAWEAYCDDSYELLQRFIGAMKQHNRVVALATRGTQSDSLAEFQAVPRPDQLWREFNEGLLVRAQTAKGTRDDWAASQDLAMFPLIEILAPRPANVCGARQAAGGLDAWTTIGRVAPGDPHYRVRIVEVELKNRGKTMAKGGVNTIIEEAKPGEWDHNANLADFEDRVRPEIAQTLGNLSDYFFLPVGNGSLGETVAVGPPRPELSRGLNSNKFSQRFAEVAVQILGARAAALTAGRCRHLVAAVWECLGKRGNTPVSLRHYFKTSPIYLARSEFHRQARTQQSLGDQMELED